MDTTLKVVHPVNEQSPNDPQPSGTRGFQCWGPAHRAASRSHGNDPHV